MKRIVVSCCILAFGHAAAQETVPKDSFYLLSPVEVRSVRASENAPFTKTNLSKAAIAKANLGQDIPFILNQVPSVVANSDAGNGVGYTGLRIRGTDATRINMTINGIPYNDAESQGLFFVNLPDFSSSAGSIQVQRGVGTSSNGAGAFGASVNFSTNEVNPDPFLELNNSIGSFNTRKHTLVAGSGVQNGFTTELRLSEISSDGFIDRASSKLRSFYFTTAWLGKKSSLRANIFSGKEKTYQAWYGISQADLEAGNRRVNYAGTERPGAPYDNETDNYTQTHYQLFFNRELKPHLQLQTALFLTKGKGYYEQYKAGESYADYGMPEAPGGFRETDLIRQLWLDNDFYGGQYSLQYKRDKTEATLGGALTHYRGLHFGKVIWAEKGLTSLRPWYDLGAEKTDVNLYWKQQTRVRDYWSLFYDLQYRHVRYELIGFRNNPSLWINNNFSFFNPKAGISYNRGPWRAYLSYGIANKEPNRDDFEAGLAEQPRPERLQDVEAGLTRTGKNYQWSITGFYMHYRDQLVLTGKINDVGAYTRTNIACSYRAGVELEGNWRPVSWFQAAGNLALSRNKVLDFTEYIDDYDNGGQKTNRFEKADIAFSPAVVYNGSLNFFPVARTEINLIQKYVSRQYLDNTQNKARSLDPFFVQDLQVAYSLPACWWKELKLVARVVNLLDTKYEPNGYTFSYISGGALATENYYFPMAGRNFMVAVNLKF